MGVRFEPSGLHLYDRHSGLHVLLDELRPDPAMVSLGPRTLSIAVTDVCDFACPHCHVKKGTTFCGVDELVSFCCQCERMGTLDVALGGGEPTLHPAFATICRRLWGETGLGVSFTTHGHHLTPSLVDLLAGSVSFARVSMDGVEPVYTRLRGRPLVDLLQHIRLLKGMIPFGLNVLITPETIGMLDRVMDVAVQHDAKEILLLPVVVAAAPQLAPCHWDALDRWIQKNYQVLPLRVGAYARKWLHGPFLFDAEWEEDYAYWATDGTLRSSSYASTGVRIADYSSVAECVLAWRAIVRRLPASTTASSAHPIAPAGSSGASPD